MARTKWYKRGDGATFEVDEDSASELIMRKSGDFTEVTDDGDEAIVPEAVEQPAAAAKPAAAKPKARRSK